MRNVKIQTVCASVQSHQGLFWFPIHLSLQCEKTCWYVRPPKTQISLRIHTVWPESLLSAWRNFESLAIKMRPVKIQISDYMNVQTALNLSLAHMSGGMFSDIVAHILYSPITVNPRYNAALVPKTLPLKYIFSRTEYLMSRLICKKGIVLFLFPYRTYVLDICWGGSNKYPKHMFL